MKKNSAAEFYTEEIIAFKKKTALLFVCVGIILLSSCSASSGGGNDNKGNKIDNTPVILSSAPSNTNVTGNEYAKIDLSDTSKGYVNICYVGGDDKVKVQIRHSSDTVYTYNLNNSGNYETFPFTCGNGTYYILVYKNISSNQYILVYSTQTEVNCTDENAVFLYPNQYVNFSDTTSFTSLSKKLADNCYSKLDVVGNVYDYVVNNIKYDYDLADNPPSGYLPDIDKIIKTKKGICFDYASLMCALLRSQQIPAKLVLGYSSDVYHAWISVYLPETGWIDNIIQFDGVSWTRMDPTYASTYNGSKSNVSTYVSDASHYNELYCY